eukprot:jgi/Botrbrau1/16440/Bobra.0142s0036.1
MCCQYSSKAGLSGLARELVESFLQKPCLVKLLGIPSWTTLFTSLHFANYLNRPGQVHWEVWSGALGGAHLTKLLLEACLLLGALAKRREKHVFPWCWRGRASQAFTQALLPVKSFCSSTSAKSAGEATFCEVSWKACRAKIIGEARLGLPGTRSHRESMSGKAVGNGMAGQVIMKNVRPGFAAVRLTKLVMIYIWLTLWKSVFGLRTGASMSCEAYGEACLRKKLGRAPCQGLEKA